MVLNDIVGYWREQRNHDTTNEVIEDMYDGKDGFEAIESASDPYIVVGRVREPFAETDLARTTGSMFDQYNSPSHSEGCVIDEKKVSSNEAVPQAELPAGLDDYLHQHGIDAGNTAHYVLKNGKETIHEIRHEDAWVQYTEEDGAIQGIYESVLEHERYIDIEDGTIAAMKVKDSGASEQGQVIRETLDRDQNWVDTLLGRSIEPSRWRFTAETYRRDAGVQTDPATVLFRNDLSFDHEHTGLLVGRFNDS